MSEHTPGYQNFRPPLQIREESNHREIRDADGRFIAMSQNSGAPHIDAELVQLLNQMAAAPLLVEACRAWLKFYQGDIPVPDGEPADDVVLAAWNDCERKIEEAMRAALAAATSKEK